MTQPNVHPVAARDMPAFRSRLRRCYRRRLERRAQDIPEDRQYRPTMVFAPHYDDETLGCGGLIRRLRMRQTPVTIVFMTDGTQSHGAGISAAELGRRRWAEGLAAAELLGVDAANVHTLAFPDGALNAHAAAAEARVSELLVQHRPANVFAPFERDTTADHIATHAIVKRAVLGSGQRTDLWCYPVWFWAYWPWSPWRDQPDMSRRWRLRRALQSHRQALRLCRWRVDVADVQAVKWAALAAHETQMARTQTASAGGDAAWPTLGDVWGGNFLACFFGAYELFAHVLGDGLQTS